MNFSHEAHVKVFRLRLILVAEGKVSATKER